jgi:hypothetical protein
MQISTYWDLKEIQQWTWKNPCSQLEGSLISLVLLFLLLRFKFYRTLDVLLQSNAGAMGGQRDGRQSMRQGYWGVQWTGNRKCVFDHSQGLDNSELLKLHAHGKKHLMETQPEI